MEFTPLLYPFNSGYTNLIKNVKSNKTKKRSKISLGKVNFYFAISFLLRMRWKLVKRGKAEFQTPYFMLSQCYKTILVTKYSKFMS